MQRTLMRSLMRWKQSPNRKPLIIRGARQVGKTWLMKEFGRQAYENYAYVNFENNAVLKDLFQQDYDVKRMLMAIQIESGVTISADKTLIILDEIQEAPGAITSLKYFQENAPEYHVISAGSLLGVALGGSTSFPVGKVEFLDLYPLTFHEFLQAVDAPLLSLLESRDWALITSFKSKLVERLRHYYFVGGMPEAVAVFSQDADLSQVRTVQKNVLIAYEQDFSKHAPVEVVPRIRMLWNAIPAQLAKENRKFIYGLIKEGARAREFELAIAWLVDCGLVHKVHNVTKPAFPLKAYEHFSAFKLFVLDIGLMGAMVQMDAKTLLEGSRIFEEFKGALTEQYVLQQLATRADLAVYYWSAENARSEVDFLLQYTNQIIPLEVKASENLQSKSLRTYCQKYQPERAIRTSLSDYRVESWMENLPLYAIGLL